jgi:hypothetical protein
MKLFAQIRKVDEANRLVYGRAAQEVVDKADEVMDYESSKPYFQKWSDDVAKDTDGKSLGNVRAMHGKVAAGKLTGIDFNDTEKAIDVIAKVVDDAEWNKVLEGVYTGFSIGGSYIGKPSIEKMDGKDVKRYTASPNEVSLVDRPCIPTATFFEVQKADGTLSKVEFKEPVTEEDAARSQRHARRSRSTRQADERERPVHEGRPREAGRARSAGDRHHRDHAGRTGGKARRRRAAQKHVGMRRTGAAHRVPAEPEILGGVRGLLRRRRLRHRQAPRRSDRAGRSGARRDDPGRSRRRPSRRRYRDHRRTRRPDQGPGEVRRRRAHGPAQGRRAQQQG